MFCFGSTLSFLHFVCCAQTLSAGEIKRPGRTKKRTAPGGFEQFLSHLNASTPNEATSSLEQQGEQDEDNTLSDVLSLSSVAEPSPITSCHSKQPPPRLPAMSPSRLVEMKPTIKVPYHIRYPLQERTDLSPGEARPESAGEVAKLENRSGQLHQSESIDLSLMDSEGEVPTIILADGGRTSGTKKKGHQKPIISPGEIPFRQHETRDGIDVINISRSSALSVNTHSREEKRDGEIWAGNSLGTSKSLQEGQRTPDEARVALPPGITAVKPLSTASGEDSEQKVTTGGGDNASSRSGASSAAVDVHSMEVESPPILSATDHEQQAESGSPALSLHGPKEDGSVESWAKKTAAQSSSTCTPDAHPHTTSSPFHLPTLSTPPAFPRPPPPINVPTAAVDLEPSSSSVAESAAEGPGEFERSPAPSYSSDFDFSSVSLVSFH